MPDRAIVVNTTPLISLAAADCLDALAVLYQRVVIPFEVAEEVRAGGKTGLGVTELSRSAWLLVRDSPVTIPTYLANALDRGEAAVIATALDNGIPLAACRTWGVESENRPQRGQFLPHSQSHSPAMGQEGGEKWTAAADL